MKIKGMDWMDWLHQSRAEAQEQRKNRRQSLSEYLRTIEEKQRVHGKEDLRPSRKRKT